MSRRQSRVSVDTRQNDTLSEFETFKKKFLLANKHITKLNSTLSVRIEELNAQISTLYVENLRLRASEIALASQLKKEREKSRKIIADAEAATHNLMKHLGLIRKSFGVPSSTPDSTPPQHIPQPRARRPPKPDPNASPPPNRIARPPDVPVLLEEDEPEFIPTSNGYGGLDDEYIPATSPAPSRRKKSRNSSSSRTSRAASPPPPLSLDLPVTNFDDELNKAGKRKPTRRQSGLLTTSMSITTLTPKGYSTEVIPQRPSSPAFGSPLRLEAALQEEEEMNVLARDEYLQDDDDLEEPLAVSVTRRERKRKNKDREKDRDHDGDEDDETVVELARKGREKRRSKDVGEGPSSPLAGKKPKLKDVTNAPPPRPSFTGVPDRDRETTPDDDLPPSAASTASTSSFATARTFLGTPSVSPNPDSYLPTPRTSSPAAVPPSESESATLTAGRERRVRKSINYAEPKLNTKMRKPDPPHMDKKRTSLASETRKSLEAPSITPSSSSSTDSAPIVGIKRKKSRVYMLADDEESDGTQADAETAGVRVGSTVWANIDGRRRSVQTGSSSRRLESDDMRRHSIAV